MALAVAVYAAMLATRTADRIVAAATTSIPAGLRSDPDTLHQLHKELGKMEEFFGKGAG